MICPECGQGRVELVPSGEWSAGYSTAGMMYWCPDCQHTVPFEDEWKGSGKHVYLPCSQGYKRMR